MANNPLENIKDWFNLDEELIDEYEEFDLIPKCQKKCFYLYELKKIFKQKDEALITFSPNSINLLIIEKEEFVEIQGWIPEDGTFEYLTKQSITNSDGELDIIQKTEQSFYTYIDINGEANFNNGKPFKYKKDQLYLITLKKIETDEDIESYGAFIQSLNYETGLTENRKGKKTIKFTDLKTWKTRDGNQVIIKIGKQFDNFNFNKLKLISPSSFLLDSLKMFGTKNEIVTSPIIKMQNELTPLWINPIEKNPGELNFLNYWFSDNVFSLEKIWELKTKDEINLKTLLPTNDDKTETLPSKTFYGVNDVKIELDNLKPYASVTNDKNNWGKSALLTNPKLSKHTFSFSKESILNNIIPIGNGTITPNPNDWINDWKFATNNWEFFDFKIPGGVGTMYMRINKIETEKINNVILKFENKVVISSLYKLLQDVLTASFNYNNNFKGAGYKKTKDESTGELNEMALYKQQFEGKNIEEYINGLEKVWKKKNANIVNDDKYKIYYQNYKIVKAMLSSYLYGEHAIARGGNDDYKFLLPWYFELTTKPTWTGDKGKEDNGTGKWEYNTDLIVKINSVYFDFDISEKKVKLKNNIISEKQILKSIDNSWYWSSIPDLIQETKLPSLTPVDFKLADENVGKFFVYDIAKNKEYYGKKNELYKTTLNKLQSLNKFKPKEWIFNLDLDIPKEIILSGVYGFGNWNIEFWNNEEQQLKIENIKLFKINKPDIGRMKIIL